MSADVAWRLQAVPASGSRWTNGGVPTSVSEQNESKLLQNLNSLVEEPPEGMAWLHPQFNLLSFLRFLFFFFFPLAFNHFPTLHHSLTSSSFAADSDLLMSCEVKGNDDEFDPIPVLISKNPSPGKVNPSPQMSAPVCRSPRNRNVSSQIDFPGLFPGVSRLARLRLAR